MQFYSQNKLEMQPLFLKPLLEHICKEVGVNNVLSEAFNEIVSYSLQSKKK